MLPLRIVIGTITVLLVLVAGPGVLHTVMLNTREGAGAWPLSRRWG
jgi:hypothetical protein